MKRASCGLEVNFPVEIRSVLNSASEYGFEFVCLPIAHPRFKREFSRKCKNREGPFTRPDLVLKSNEWNSLIAGKISPYINVDCEVLHEQAKLTLEQELNYGGHLDVPAIIISLKNGNCFNLARIINSNLSGLKPYQIWMQLPLISHVDEASIWRSDYQEVTRESPWEWWNNFRILCHSDKNLGVILEISTKLPPQNELNRWVGEPLKCLVISTSAFLTNKKGYPVLSKAHQAFIKSLVPLDVQVVIKGNNHHYNYSCYQKYIDHLWQEAHKEQNLVSEDVSNENTIQCPLQPLANDLVSKTYELFEKDSVKYRLYTKAIYTAFQDNFIEKNFSETINVMVVGAGRGPLVMATIEAAEKTNKKVKIYAVEKNPHAVVTLETYQEEIWKDYVEVIPHDVRYLNFPKKIDILLSELLGSFGDNELSPELLDEAQKFLKEGGISIPESYTSYLCPLQGSKVYSDLKATKEKSDCEMPYVIMHKNKYNISETKALFTFHHPNYSNPIQNTRYKRLIFKAEQNCILHGFSGFFETILYKDIKLSIVPETYTPGLCSWYPIFFPLMEPVQIKAGNELEVHFWRLVGNTKVWYEWTLTKPIPLPVHNTNGRSSSIGLR